MSPAEYAHEHLNEALLLPVNELRGRLVQLERGRKVLVHCQVEHRAYLASRILKQNGFEVVNLDDGFEEVVQGVSDKRWWGRKSCEG